MVEQYDVVQSWGTSGERPDQLGSPFGIAVDGRGSVYVADATNHRILKFSAKGQFIATWGHFSSSDDDEWDDGFDSPFGIAVDHRGNAYIADCKNARIQHWTSDGVFVGSWSRWGRHRGPFSPPAGVAVDRVGNVFVFDGRNGRVQVFDGVTHRCLTVWGGWSEALLDGRFHRREGFCGIAVDADGNVHVTDSGNHRVQKFTRNGRFLAAWGSPGDQPGEFRTPLGIAVDADRQVYVVDSLNNRVQKFTCDGVLLTEWGRPGAAPGEFTDPIGIAVADSGWVHVTDAGNHRVQTFVPRP